MVSTDAIPPHSANGCKQADESHDRAIAGLEIQRTENVEVALDETDGGVIH